jgi:hypothetical protein
MRFQQIVRESKKPTDAHKGLPYYMTLERAERVEYSRLVLCGRPSSY